MAIEFPKEEENFSSQKADMEHKNLAEVYLHLMKLQSNCEFFYWKLSGFFFLCILGALILHSKGIFTPSLETITIIGCCSLLIFAHKIKRDLKYGSEMASYLEKGLPIEKKYNHPARLFRIFEENKTLAYRANLISRGIPFAFISLTTFIAGIALAERTGRLASIIVIAFSTTILFSSAYFYIKKSKKIAFVK